LRRPPFRTAAALFPETLRFGVATSDHQCEAYDPGREDIRDLWERAAGQTPRGKGTDFWNRFSEDIRLARGIGCRAFRFSVSWTRVEPSPGRFDASSLAHYADIARKICDEGMDAIVTLHHFTWPPHLEADGGMIGQSFPHRFADYAGAVARSLAGHVRWWITINEPTFLPLGYVRLWGHRSYLMPPGLGDASATEQIEAATTLIRNLFLAHTEARARIQAVAPGAQVGVNPFVLGMPSMVQDLLDRLASRARDPEAWKERERMRLQGGRDRAGRVDVAMGALTMTPEREAQALFSQPYAEAIPAVMVDAGSALKSAADLDGRAIAVARGTSSEADLRGLPRPPRVFAVRTLSEGFARLRKGEVAGLASDDGLLRTVAEPDVERWRIIPLGRHPQWYCAAVGLNREGFLREVDAAILEVRAAQGRASSRSAGPVAASRPSDLPERLIRLGTAPDPATTQPGAASVRAAARTDPAIERIRRRGEVVVGIRRGPAPYSSIDPSTGARKGVEVEIGRALARRILRDANRVRFVELEARERIGRLRSPWSRVLDFIARWRALFSTLTNTNWWYLGMSGRLPSFLCPPECVGKFDFVGFDYYWGVAELRWDRLLRLFDSFRQRYSRAPVFPRGLRRMLRRYARMFPGKDILIIENGCVEHADGVSRADYLRAHLREVQRACAEGVPVRAYVYWSITTNREWGLPLGADSDFGLYRCELDGDPGLRRVRTASADAYSAIIAARDARQGLPWLIRERGGRGGRRM
jgi:beta-glucosidase/6-phospho-beta-glucosidase/beta-galactosidase/ABC-type amino acid transport substrate-binding protein